MVMKGNDMFTNEQLNNLAVFLPRVNLNGAEVPAYVSIVDTINRESQARQDNVLSGPVEPVEEVTEVSVPELLIE